MTSKKLAIKSKKVKVARGPVQAAGGIVVRFDREPLIAVVQLRRLGHWVLPKGKLNVGEDALVAARREVLEETGHQVSVHEYLGTLSYEVRRGPKVVQFWRMQANGGPVRKLMRDVKAVRWLPLGQAVETLTHPREQAFLAQVGPTVLKAAENTARKPKPPTRPEGKSPVAVAKPPVDVDAGPAPRDAGNDPLPASAKSFIEKIRSWILSKR